MGKKKRGHPDLEEVLSRPWCYYCERDFDDLKILIDHQRAKHFKCDKCGRRLNTAGGLNVHMSQVHKEQLTAVDNALPNRSGLDIEIFGTEGIPEEIVQQHRQRVLQNYHQAEAERRAATGNPAPGAAGAQSKKPKFESPSEMKARLAAHKAKMNEQGTGGNSGGGTPLGAGQTHSPAIGQSANGFQPPGTNHYPPFPQQYNGAPPNGVFGQPPPFNQPSSQVPPFQQPPGFQPTPSFSPPPFQGNVPPPTQQFQNPQFSPPPIQNGPPHFQQGPPGGPHPSAFPTQHQQPGRTHTPPQNGQRPPSLPPAPGLPQRPAFGAPHVNAYQMQQMHQGQIPGPPNPVMSQPPPGQDISPVPYGQPQTQQQQQQQQPPVGPPPGMSDGSANATSLDDLISGASKQAEAAAAVANAANNAAPATEAQAITTKVPEQTVSEEKAGKKEKEKSKAAKLVYSDNETSPEEKMSLLSRYAFTPEPKRDVVLGRPEGAVTGPAGGADDVADATRGL